MRNAKPEGRARKLRDAQRPLTSKLGIVGGGKRARPWAKPLKGRGPEARPNFNMPVARPWARPLKGRGPVARLRHVWLMRQGFKANDAAIN